MIDHVSVGVADLERAARFYEATLAPLGLSRLVTRPATIGFGKNYPEFWINLRAAMASGGTSSELTFAYRRGIPVYLVTDSDLNQVSGWMLACADRVFPDIDGLKKFLLERYGKEKQAPLWRV